MFFAMQHTFRNRAILKIILKIKTYKNETNFIFPKTNL